MGLQVASLQQICFHDSVYLLYTVVCIIAWAATRSCTSGILC